MPVSHGVYINFGRHLLLFDRMSFLKDSCREEEGRGLIFLLDACFPVLLVALDLVSVSTNSGGYRVNMIQ